MTYMIDARLEQGTPSLTLIDAITGEKRLHWRGNSVTHTENDWKGLFKRLMLLSCADQVGLVQRAESPTFGDECVICNTCVDHDVSTETQTHMVSTETKTSNGNSAVSLLKLPLVKLQG